MARLFHRLDASPIASAFLFPAPGADAFGRDGDPPGATPLAPPTLQRVLAQSERLPSHVMYGITLLTAVGMALLNLVTISFMRTLVKTKFHLMQAVTDAFGVGAGAVALIGCAALLATCCMGLIFAVDPTAGSSGAPENRGWLNGNPCGNFFTVRSLLVRGSATILGNAAGYPVGREGPTVTMGSNLAFLITGVVARPYTRQWVNVDTSDGQQTPALVVDEERLAAARRIACAVGGACGMAMIFDSPIGGILYMFEEIGAHCWPLELTGLAFVGTITCALLSRGMLNLCGTDTKAFVVYEWSPQRHPWDLWDVPTVILIAAVLGPFSSFHTRICLAVGRCRQWVMAKLHRFQPYAKVVEAILYAAFCATMCAVVALFGACEPLRPGDSGELVRYNCPRGYYNPVASLLLTTSEGAVNLLFSRRNANEIHPVNALLALCAYTTLNIFLTGVPAPSGNFTGTMLIGGLVGRILGAATQDFNPDETGAAASGVYAMVGSAAMLCGFKRMSLAVVWFVSIASNDFNMVAPLMLSVTVSLVLARLCKERGYDEEQVLLRKVPFLEADPPVKMERMRAKGLVDRVPDEAALTPGATATAVALALQLNSVTDFPVVREGDICIGFTTRERLKAALKACARRRELANAGGDGIAQVSPLGLDDDTSDDPGEAERLIKDVSQSTSILQPNDRIPVERLIDPVPHIVLEDMLAPRLYALFARAGVNVVCVVNERGQYQGMITRGELIKRCREMDE